MTFYHQQMYKMERLIEDALNVHKLLPWVETEEDIINFMRRIPYDKTYLRNQLALYHFLKEKDGLVDNEQIIEDEAREIVVVFPDVPYREIKDRLSVLGSISNRKEVVIRQLLVQKRELGKMMSEIDSAKKRKNENIFDIHSNNDETNIKIKIRKVDGALKVMSSIKQEKVSTVPYNSSSEEESDSMSSSCYSDISESRFSNIDKHPILLPSFSNKLQPKKTVQQDSHSNDVQTNTHSTANNLISHASQTENHLNSTDAPTTPNITATPFNLVSYLQEITHASNKKIKNLCNKHGLGLTEKPNETLLVQLLDTLMLPEVIQLYDSSNSLSSDTEEYFDDESGNVQEPYSADDVAVANVVEAQNNPSLSKPVQVITNREVLEMKDGPVIADETNPTSNQSIAPSELKTKNEKNALIQPAKFIPPISNRPKPNDPDVQPAFPQEIWTQLNLAIAAFQQEHPVEDDDEDIDENELEPATPKDLKKENKEVEAVPVTSTAPVQHNKVVEDFIRSGPSTSTSSCTHNAVIKDSIEAVPSTSRAPDPQPEPLPSTSKEPDSSTDRTTNTQEKMDEKLFLRLVEIFPQACPNYLKSLCKIYSFHETHTAVSQILSDDNYPKRPERAPSPPLEVDFEDQFYMVKSLLPEADPQYLRMKCWDFANNIDGLTQFINDATENKNYPTMKEYLRKQQLSAQTKQYTTEFNVENFVELFPDPHTTFNDPKRIVNLDKYCQGYLMTFFQNKYDKLPIKTVRTILLHNKYRILASDTKMRICMLTKQVMKSRRKPSSLPEPAQNILFLQELAYLEHREEVEAYIESKKLKDKEERRNAKDKGLMQTCNCCYDEEVMPKDTFECPKGCKFCSDCIKKSCEIAFGEGKTDFKCLQNCTEEFSLQTLKNVLPPKMFSKIAQKKALAEVKAAGIEDLVICPFCDFANIPAENDKIFRCLNPECMKESCLQCKETNHLPLRCDEIEKDDDVKARLFVEDQMTEALLRKCWKCGTKFYKEEGCNKMTCNCGANMCYICREPVTDYKHFNGLGGDRFDLCPLYTNTNEDNERAVLEAAKAAKAQIDPSKLKVDPSADVKEHYKKRMQALPVEPHMHLLQAVGPPNHLVRNVNANRLGQVGRQVLQMAAEIRALRRQNNY